MSEAIIAKRGSGNNKKIKIYTRQIITDSQRWEVPDGIINNEVYVELIGGGGGSLTYSFTSGNNYNKLYYAGGGGGYFNNGICNIRGVSSVFVTIGSRGGYSHMGSPSGGSNRNGGTTSFGTYLSANGGTVPIFYSINDTYFKIEGGSGGTGGGILFSNCNLHGYTYYDNETEYYELAGGKGYQFGGGGVYVNNNASGKFVILNICGGNGGMWGGGGGIFCKNETCINQYPGIGGTYGGNGGTIYKNAENGTNTNSMNIPYFNNYLKANGRGRKGNNGGGGGGYGGDGGNNGGGGGGYGYYGSASYGGSYFGGGGGGYHNGGLIGGGGLAISNKMNYGWGGSGSSTYENGGSGVCVIYYYKWINDGDNLGT